jgi:hypothetical protein
MKFIKEYCKAANRAVIRTQTYTHSWGYFFNLVKEAKKDFPGLTTDKIEIVHYGGRHYKGTYGIEFVLNKKIPISKEYTQISNLEFSL